MTVSICQLTLHGMSWMLSPRFPTLGIGAAFISACPRSRRRGNNFTFPQPAAKKYGMEPSSLWRHIKEPVAGTFISVCSGKPHPPPAACGRHGEQDSTRVWILRQSGSLIG